MIRLPKAAESLLNGFAIAFTSNIRSLAAAVCRRRQNHQGADRHEPDLVGPRDHARSLLDIPSGLQPRSLVALAL
jgi:hypothetical protein